MNRFERLIAWMSPKWGESRARARLMARHFEAASSGRRTSGWHRQGSDANAAASGATLALLRAQSRDLVRNNPWARRGLRRIFTNTVGWGIRPKATGRNAAIVMERWKLWAETTQCDAAGRLTFYGLQRLVMRTVAESGEVLIRRRWRRPEDGLAIPLQLQVLEPDYLDSGKDGMKGEAGGPIVQGVEFDALGRRVAYWLFDQHPGGRGLMVGSTSRRIPADGVLHVYDQERAGQVRGPSWFASVDVRLHDFDEFEDATLMKQKIAACMAAFVTDLDGAGTPLGAGGTDAKSGQPMDTIEPGMIMNLPVGKQVTVANPPQASDHQSFSASSLRGVAAGLGVPYEDLTGDYSQVNYSSARMARLAFTADVHDWRWNMIIPQFCAPAWMWMIEALILTGVELDKAPAEWTPPAVQMLDPDKEIGATAKAVRSGSMTHDEMIREQGHDPEEYWTEYAAGLERLDKLGIVLDSDPRRMTAAGQQQQPAGSETKGTKPTSKSAGPSVVDDDAKAADDEAGDAAAPPKKPTTKPPAPEAKAGAQTETKVFAYHQPFMKVKEIREGVGLPTDIEDAELFANEFVAKHSGATASVETDDDSSERSYAEYIVEMAEHGRVTADAERVRVAEERKRLDEDRAVLERALIDLEERHSRERAAMQDELAGERERAALLAAERARLELELATRAVASPVTGSTTPSGDDPSDA